MSKRALALLLAIFTGTALAQPEAAHRGVPHLDHVFIIMMENHHISQILGNPNAPFINSYTATANLANNYFGVGHPSLTNYLEVVGGSNFGIVNDFSPDWHNTACVSNIESDTVSNEASTANICPIAGSGMDAPTPAVDTTNEGTPQEPVFNDPLPAAFTQGISIADQLVAANRTWRAYQENLPPYGADGVNNSDGLVSDKAGTPSEPGMPKFYAVKHDPFVYFASVQSGSDRELSLRNVTDFHQLFADLKSGHVANFNFITPNQCHDQHGRGSGEVGPGCSVDQNTIAQGDAALNILISTIKGSHAWKEGNNVIVTVWDENDFSSLPNQVLAIVDTNYSSGGKISNVKYNHFSLLKTIEAGFGLSFINHAADDNVKLMTDLFGR
ncbi:MAG TPA: alkaline phosphatase family protein [Candidatus Sulfotelmatobacter sp.]|nr:alkaline phosphatase family protein [Candidatus Sulfotelmatobacter sp.]